MIVKELDPLVLDASKQAKAGRRAEAQMAFYLRRALGEDTTIRVLNGLRVERRGEVAQIDHLLITPHGFILIESKSVTTQIRVNGQGEWSRQGESGWQGMPSPLLQVERQAELLKALLSDHVDQFFRKLLTFQFTFDSVPFDGLVAISDTGVIQRPPGFAIKQVLKADQITSRIQEINEAYRRASGLFSLSLKDAGAEWSSKTVTKLTEFLLQRHTPQPQPSRSPISTPQPQPESRPTSRPKAAVLPTLKPQLHVASSPQPGPVQAASPSAATAPTHTCRACGSRQLTILYGKYGYYFKCADCDGNTPIKVTGANGERAKLSKRGQEFYVVFSEESEPQLFYTNPS